MSTPRNLYGFKSIKELLELNKVRRIFENLKTTRELYSGEDCRAF